MKKENTHRSNACVAAVFVYSVRIKVVRMLIFTWLHNIFNTFCINNDRSSSMSGAKLDNAYAFGAI